MKTVIGLEIHVQLKTKSKMFCRCDNNAEQAAPNTLVCPICMGMPGTLPVANSQAIEWVLKTGLALNCQIAEFSRFDRKHYFYPDLPKGYQISQYDRPFASHGWLEISNLKSQISKIRIRRVHLEEDAGKLLHRGESTLVDLNRAGTPLMEIVSEPDINSPTEAKIFMQELRSILRYLDVSDADMEKGHLRCDANISISEDGERKTEDGLGTPVEIKNMNSFRMVERALLYEEKRQKEELVAGHNIEKETRGWNDAKGITVSQRGKEFAQDYRYFPEPDLPPFRPHQLFNVENLKQELPELPAEKRERYINSMKLPSQDAAVLSIDSNMASYFERVAEAVNPKLAANWVINELKTDGLLDIAPEDLASLLEKIESGEISGKMAKEIFIEMHQGKSVDKIIAEKGIKQIGGEEELGSVVDDIISENEKSVADYRSGKKEALGFLIGQIMKKTKGAANPQIVNKLLIEKL